MTSDYTKIAAALFHMRYPKLNFYNTDSDHQRTWIEYAKNVTEYYKTELENATKCV